MAINSNNSIISLRILDSRIEMVFYDFTFGNLSILEIVGLKKGDPPKMNRRCLWVN